MEYIIKCNEDNSFDVRNNALLSVGGISNIKVETKNMLSFSLQYLYSVLNPDELVLTKSSKDQVIETINSFDFDPEDVRQLSKIITKLGYNLNQVMMTYDNGIPKNWGDDM